VRGRGAARLLHRMSLLPRLASRFDVFHFHTGTSFFPSAWGNLDARLLRRAGKRVVVEFWGSEARLPSVEGARNPFYVNAYAEDDAENSARLRRWAEITEGNVVVSDHSLDPALSRFFPHIHVVGQRVDTERLAPAFPDPQRRVPRVVHAPSQHAAKGTRHVREAVATLREGGLEFEYVEVHGRTHNDALEIYRSADLVIDQLCIGSYGVFAAEAMSLGKPVICYLMPSVRPTYPADLPLIDATPLTLTEVLGEWIRSPMERHALGRRSRAYAERVHDCRAVARRLLAAYTRLP
jgi:hypothetical protein